MWISAINITLNNIPQIASIDDQSMYFMTSN